MTDDGTATSEFRNAVAEVIGMDSADFYTQEEHELHLLRLYRAMPEESRDALIGFAEKVMKKP